MKNKKKSLFLLILACFIFFQFSIDVYAHDAYFILSLVDDGTQEYDISVVRDKANMINREKAHLEPSLWDVTTGGIDSAVSAINSAMSGYSSQDILKEMPNHSSIKKLKKQVDENDSGFGRHFYTFMFPPREFTKPYKNNATQHDADRAFEISNTLETTINDMLKIANYGKPYPSLGAMLKVGSAIGNKSTSLPNFAGRGNVSVSYNSDDTVTLTDDKGKKYNYVYRMKKGYNTVLLEDNSKSPLNSDVFDYSDDVEYISIQHLVTQAHYSAFKHEYFLDNQEEFTKPSTLTLALTDALMNFIETIENKLGLESLDELIYNKGLRKKDTYYHGVMPVDWMNNAIVFQYILQGIAWSVLVLAFVKLIIEKEISTINPQMRVSLMNSIKDLIITTLLLMTNFIIVKAMFVFNEQIVEIFSASLKTSIVNPEQAVRGYNTLGGVFIRIYFLFIGAYFNAVYIIRAITIAMLIAFAPYFITKLAFGGGGRRSFSLWLSQLTGNIFMQSFHAMILAFFNSVLVSSRGIEKIVLYMALISLTQMFRQMFTGGVGDQAGALAGRVKSNLTGAVVGGAGGLLAGMTMDKDKEDKPKGQYIGGAGGGSSKNSSDVKRSFDKGVGGGSSQKGSSSSQKEVKDDFDEMHKSYKTPNVDKVDDVGDSTPDFTGPDTEPILNLGGAEDFDAKEANQAFDDEDDSNSAGSPGGSKKSVEDSKRFIGDDVSPSLSAKDRATKYVGFAKKVGKGASKVGQATLGASAIATGAMYKMAYGSAGLESAHIQQNIENFGKDKINKAMGGPGYDVETGRRKREKNQETVYVPPLETPKDRLYDLNKESEQEEDRYEEDLNHRHYHHHNKHKQNFDKYDDDNSDDNKED